MCLFFFLVLFQMESNNHFNYGTHSSANSGLKLSSGDSLYTNGSSMSFPQQGKSEYFPPLALSQNTHKMRFILKIDVGLCTHFLPQRHS